MTTFAPVREAYKLWLLTAPQLTLEVDDLTKFEEPVRVATASPAHPATAESAGSSIHIGAVPVLPAVPGASEGRAAPNTHTNGSIRKPSWASADGAARRVTP